MVGQKKHRPPIPRHLHSPHNQRLTRRLPLPSPLQRRPVQPHRRPIRLHPDHPLSRNQSPHSLITEPVTPRPQNQPHHHRISSIPNRRHPQPRNIRRQPHRHPHRNPFPGPQSPPPNPRKKINRPTPQHPSTPNPAGHSQVSAHPRPSRPHLNHRATRRVKSSARHGPHDHLLVGGGGGKERTAFSATRPRADTPAPRHATTGQSTLRHALMLADVPRHTTGR